MYTIGNRRKLPARSVRLSWLCAVSLLGIPWGATAQASVTGYLTIPNVRGASLAQPGAMDVSAWKWGITQNKDGQAGICVQDIQVTKAVDSGTADLLAGAATQTVYDHAVLTLRKTLGDTEIDFLTITMWDVQIKSISTGSTAGDSGVTEKVALNFDEAVFAYTPESVDGSAGMTKEAAVTSARNCK